MKLSRYTFSGRGKNYDGVVDSLFVLQALAKHKKKSNFSNYGRLLPIRPQPCYTTRKHFNKHVEIANQLELSTPTHSIDYLLTSAKSH